MELAWITAKNASEPKRIFISIADVRKIHQVKVRLRPSHEVDAVFDGTKRHLCEMRYVALRPGTYRFSYGYGGNAKLESAIDRLTELHSSTAKTAVLPGVMQMASRFRISIPCLRTGRNRLINRLCLAPSSSPMG